MNENTIEIKLVGEPTGGPTGGGGQPRPPVGSSQDVNRVAGEPNLRDNKDLSELFGFDSSADSEPQRFDAGPSPSTSKRMDAEQKEEAERYNRVVSGLARQRVAEEQRAKQEEEAERRRSQREAARVAREEEAERKREQREAASAARQQAREEEAERRKANRVFSGLANQKRQEEEREEKELNADLKRQYDQRVKLGKEALRLQEKADKEAKDAENTQRLKYIQAGQGAAQLANSQGAGGKVSGFMQLAGSGFLGEGAEGFANSPAGGMLTAGAAIVDAVDGLIRAGGAAAREGIQAGANVGRAVIGNDPAGAIAAATEGIAGFAEKVPIAGTLFAEQLRTSTAGLQAFNEVVLAAVNRAKELEQFNARIAGANARAEVRRVQDDIAEAQRNEQSFASIVDAQSRIESNSRAVFDPIKDAFLEILAELLTLLADIGEDVKPAARGIAKIVAFAVKAEAGVALFPLRMLATVIDLAFKFLGGKDEPPADLLDQVNKTLDNLRNGKSERNPADEADKPGKTNKMKTPNFFGGK